MKPYRLGGRADNDAPVFNGKQRDYKEFRKRREPQQGNPYNIIKMVTRRAWDLVGDLNIESLAETNGFDLVCWVPI